MNKLLLYISILFAAFIVSCAQQSESAMNDASMVEEMSEESIAEPAYYWADESSEFMDQEEVTIVTGEEQKNQWANEDLLNQDAITEDEMVIAGNVTEKDKAESPKNEEKLMTAYVKQRISDLMDLGAIYEDPNNSDAMKQSAKSEILLVLGNDDFANFEKSLFFSSVKNKKLNFTKLDVLSDEEFVGVVEINTKGQTNQVAFKVVSQEMDYGTSRKFEILGIRY